MLPAENNDFEMPVEGFTGTPEEIEKQWLKKSMGTRRHHAAIYIASSSHGLGPGRRSQPYQPLHWPQVRVGLRGGDHRLHPFYAIWTTFYQLGIAKTPMTILENNCMQSTASAAGYSTGTTLVSAFSAFILITGNPLPVGLTLAWVFFLAVLGVTMAIPMKRQMINVEQLRFPSGLAAAETLRALHSHGAKGMRAAKALGLAGGLAALSQFLTDGLRLVSQSLEPFQIGSLLNKANEAIFGKAWMGRTVMFTWDPIFIAAGAITGMKVCLSMLVSGTICWAIYLPMLQSQGSTSMFAAVDFRDEAAGAAFVEKLKAGATPLSVYLWNGLSEPARQTLQGRDLTPPVRTSTIARELDRMLVGASLYDPARFAGVKLSLGTSELLTATRESGDRIRLNRQLLQDAYPEIAAPVGFRGLVQWSLWGGTACMVASGLLTFLLQWKTSVRAFRNLGKMFNRGGSGDDPMDEIEAPTSWFLVGQVISLIVLGYLAKKTFDMPYWIGGLALVMSFVLALVACRVTGETDTTPVGAMGQITQLTIGALHPGSATTTLMSANVVSSAAIASADLLTDLKSGYLLGANPRKQFLAQFAGIFIGTLVTVLAFRVMVPGPSALGTDQFPAPGRPKLACRGSGNEQRDR